VTDAPRHRIAPQLEEAEAAVALFHRLLAPDSTYMRRRDEPGILDFFFGNPHEMPVPGYAEALARWSEPRHEGWFSYMLNHPPAQEVVARTLRERTGMPFEAGDVSMTNGAFAGLAVAIRTLAGPGDEVVFVSPPWFQYESMILAAGARAVRVRARAGDFDLDVDAIAAAISPSTRAVIVNSPHNPTGRIYPAATLERLARVLEQASRRNADPVYLISDEAYNRIVYDGRECPSPLAFHRWSILVYTYGKTLLTPGERLGYLALPPTMPDRGALMRRLHFGQLMTGWAFPNAVLQYALADLEPLCIDVARLEARRNRLVAALSEAGYELLIPQGTFYLMARSPWPDDPAFCELLAEHGVLVLPGAVVELPGWFRVSLTASDAMVAAAIPRFGEALARAREASSA